MPSTSSIVDTFDGGTLNTTLWSGSYGAITVSGGRAQIPCGTGYVALKPADEYTFDSVFLQVWPPAADGATEAYIDVLLRSAAQPGGTDLGFHIDAVTGALESKSRSGYYDPSPASTTYSATDHRWLRLRLSGGDVLFEAAPDADTWTVLRTVAAPAWLTAASDVSVNVESHRNTGATNYGEVDNVNTPPPVPIPTGIAIPVVLGAPTADTSYESLAWPSGPASTNNVDGSQAYHMGARFHLLDGAECVGARWWVPDTVPTPPGGTHYFTLWRVSDETLLAQKSFTPVPGGDQDVLFDTPVTLSAVSEEYVVAVYTIGYVFRSVTPPFLVESPSLNIRHDRSALVPWNAGTVSYPDGDFAAWYYVSPLIEVGGPSGATGASPAGLSVSVAVGAPTVHGLSASPAGLAPPVAVGVTAAALGRSAAPPGTAVPVSAGSATAAPGLTAAPSGATAPVSTGAPVVSLSLAAIPGGVVVPVGVGPPSTLAPMATSSPNWPLLAGGGQGVLISETNARA